MNIHKEIKTTHFELHYIYGDNQGDFPPFKS